MQTVDTLLPLRQSLAALRAGRGGDARVALVPTMGALHEGHIALVREARKAADVVVVSIFVNPRQFGPGEDLDAYPRQLAADQALLKAEAVDLLWAPRADAMYPAHFSTNVSVAGVSEGLCGGERPGHFDGVATVVLKLFNQVGPDLAFFGEKDWQQLAVIRRMARDLDLTATPAEAIFGVPTIREDDGLAMSSRNAYLLPAQREAASRLPRAMRETLARIDEGAAVPAALGKLREDLVAAGFDRVDYAELRDADTLAPLDGRDANARLFVAARIGATRLIDNMAL